MKLVSCLLVPLLAAPCAALTACTALPDPATGTLTLDLVGTAPSGTQYRLRDAKILVRGPDADSTKLWNTEDAPDRTSLSADVSPGDYLAAVLGGWRLERLAGTAAIPVAAMLVSDNPVQFTVAARRRTAVPLRFRVDGDVVDMTQGYDITLTVDEPRAPVMVISNGGNFESDPPLQRSIAVYPADADGDAAPLRTIAGPHTTLSDPIDVVLAGDRIIVSDVEAIDVFPLSASGDVAPTTRIAGPSTGITSIQSIAVSNGEIYAVQNDHSLLVFPLTASGDVPPIRRITSPWLNPFHTVVDHGEIYVLDANSESRVLVFPASAEGAVLPTRTLRWAPEPLAVGLAISGGELFVATESSIDVLPAHDVDGEVTPLRSIAPISGVFQIAVFQGEIYAPSFQTNRVMVFPADASGSVAPTRTIAGPGTRLDGPVGVSVN